MNSISIETLRAEQQDAVCQLLKSHGLPTEGLDGAHVVGLVARDGTQVIGSAAIEVYGKEGLLRSVAVAEPYRRRSVGSRLTQAALDLARQRGLFSLYLLTETAPAFFPKFGFAPLARKDVPANVQESFEFRGGGCCVAAQAFWLSLASDAESRA